MKYYAVKIGRTPGIYTTWTECQLQIKGFPSAKFKSFKTILEAENYLSTFSKKVKVRENRNTIVAYTDGSCINKVGGFAYLYFKRTENQQYTEKNGRVPINPCTNQKAELYAILQLLKDCKEDIIIHTDSQYSIDCVTDWCHNWIKNGWKTSKGKDVLNKELIVDILNLMKDRNVLFKHVYAHIGIKHNERVDTLAKLGTLE